MAVVMLVGYGWIGYEVLGVRQSAARAASWVAGGKGPCAVWAALQEWVGPYRPASPPVLTVAADGRGCAVPAYPGWASCTTETGFLGTAGTDVTVQVIMAGTVLYPLPGYPAGGYLLVGRGEATVRRPASTAGLCPPA
jgi:hypothetical protein